VSETKQYNTEVLNVY